MLDAVVIRAVSDRLTSIEQQAGEVTSHDKTPTGTGCTSCPGEFEPVQSWPSIGAFVRHTPLPPVNHLQRSDHANRVTPPTSLVRELHPVPRQRGEGSRSNTPSRRHSASRPPPARSDRHHHVRAASRRRRCGARCEPATHRCRPLESNVVGGRRRRPALVFRSVHGIAQCGERFESGHPYRLAPGVPT